MDIILALLLGAISGSFLNVVIYRLPLMLAGQSCSLRFPASFCPQCRSPIRWRHNLPLLGWLVLRGRCADCRQPISWRYPLTEGITALMFARVVMRHGVTLHSAFLLLAACLLLALAVIDWRTMLLPDRLVAPLAALGMLASALQITPVAWREALIAAMLGFTLPWLLDGIYYLRHGYHGMGRGDMKLFSALGSWFGITTLCHIMLFSALIALLIAVLWLRIKKREPFPFGPYPCLVALFYFLVR